MLSAPDTSPLTLVFAVLLAIVHIASGRLRFLAAIPRNRWLSIAGGASVAYVFVHIFPELDIRQEMIAEMDAPAIAFLKHQLYLVALIGFAVFYGLERLALSSRQQIHKQQEPNRTPPTIPTSSRVFALHIASFALYNMLIGYLLLHREDPGLDSLFFFSSAMALHFVVNDHGLREHHKHSYDWVGRWVLAAAIIIGWGIGRATELSEAAIALLFAFLAGGVILNVIKEELPEERESRFGAFILGASVYSALLLAS